MSKISRRQLAKTTVRLLREQPKNRAQIVAGVAAHLVEAKQAAELHLLMHDIARELLLDEAHLLAEVRSAFPLDDTTRRAVTSYLQQHTGAKTVELDEQTDPALLAGMIVRTADQQLDTSAHSKLRRLQAHNAQGM